MKFGGCSLTGLILKYFVLLFEMVVPSVVRDSPGDGLSDFCRRCAISTTAGTFFVPRGRRLPRSDHFVQIFTGQLSKELGKMSGLRSLSVWRNNLVGE